MPAAVPVPRARIVVLLSGTGSLCAALLDATDDPAYPAEVVAVGSDRPAEGLAHATRRGLPTFVCALGDHADRAAWDRALVAQIGAYRPDLVVSAGFMKIVGPAVLDAFGGRLINTHPALLPAFPGAHAVRDALAAGATVTGATVHVVDAGDGHRPGARPAGGRRPRRTTTRRGCTNGSRKWSASSWWRRWRSSSPPT